MQLSLIRWLAGHVIQDEALMAGYMFGCPHCGAKLEARDASRAGRAVTCPQCQQVMTIPPPPPMGIPLGGTAAPTQEPSSIQVSTDKGFKRGMSPAKAYSDTDAASPLSEASAPLPSQGSLDNAEPFVLASTGDVEGYDLHINEPAAEEEAAAPVKKKKKKERIAEEPVPEPPSPWEDPKYQLLALIGVVLIIGGLWNWISSGTKPEEEPATPLPPPVTAPVQPGMLPGDSGTSNDLKPKPVTGLPGASETPPVSPPAKTLPPSSTTLPGQLPGATEEVAPTGPKNPDEPATATPPTATSSPPETGAP